MSGKDVGHQEFSLVSTEFIEKLIGGLKETGAVGTDEISTSLLKKFKRLVSVPLCHIINLAITTAKYPSEWKHYCCFCECLC